MSAERTKSRRVRTSRWIYFCIFYQLRSRRCVCECWTFFFFLTPAFWEWNDCGHKLTTKLLFSLLHSKCSLEFIFCIPGRHVWSSFFWSVRWRTPRWSLHFVEFGWSTLLDDCRSQKLLCLNCVCVRIKVCLTLSGEAFHSLLSTRGRCVCSRVI